MTRFFRCLPVIFAASCASAAEIASVAAAADDSHSASFLSLARAALENDAGIAAAESQRNVAREGISLARAALLPQLSFAAQYAWNSIETGGDNEEQDASEKTLILTQPLLNFAALRRYRGARHAAEAGESDYRAARQILLLDVIVARLSLHNVVDLSELLEKRESNLQEQLELTRQHEAGGIGTHLDVVMAEAELEGVRADIQDARSDRRRAQNALSRLVGREIVSPPPLKPDFIFAPPPERAAALAEMNAHNPSLRAAMLRTAELRERYAAADADMLLPSVNAFAERAWQTSGAKTAAAGLQMQFPLYAGGRQIGQRRQIFHLLLQTENTAENVRRQLSETLNNLRADAQSAIGRARALRAAIDGRRVSLEKNQIAWREGARLATDVLRAEEELFNAELRLRDLIYEYMSSMAQIRSITSGIDESYLLHLDSFFI